MNSNTITLYGISQSTLELQYKVRRQGSKLVVGFPAKPLNEVISNLSLEVQKNNQKNSFLAQQLQNRILYISSQKV